MMASEEDEIFETHTCQVHKPVYAHALDHQNHGVWIHVTLIYNPAVLQLVSSTRQSETDE
jgi:hypothetical protein